MEKNRFRLSITPISKELQTPAIPGGILTTLSGNYISIFKGAGLEFRDFRYYAPMDDAKRIDWKASLKTDKLLVKEFQEERNAEVIFCYDVSAGMIFGSGKKLKNHYGAEFIVSLGKHIIDSGNSIGLITFTKKEVEFIPPALGEDQLFLLMDILSSFSTYGHNGGFKKVLNFLENNVLEGTTVFLVSDFFLFRKFKKYDRILRVLSRKFKLIFVILRDPAEEFFVSTRRKPVILLNPESNLNIMVRPSSIKKEYTEETKKEKHILKKYLTELGIPVLEIYTDRSFIAPLYEFFNRLEVI